MLGEDAVSGNTEVSTPTAEARSAGQVTLMSSLFRTQVTLTPSGRKNPLWDPDGLTDIVAESLYAVRARRNGNISTIGVIAARNTTLSHSGSPRSLVSHLPAEESVAEQLELGRKRRLVLPVGAWPHMSLPWFQLHA